MSLIVLASALLGILGLVVAFRARLARRAAGVRRELGEPHRFDAGRARASPSVRSIHSAIDDLAAGAAPFRMRGEMWSALESNLARVRSGEPSRAVVVARFRAALLDREIAVPLYFLEVFARR